MSTPARKRLMKDFKRIQNDPPSGVSASPLDNNVMAWQAVIFGKKVAISFTYYLVFKVTYN